MPSAPSINQRPVGASAHVCAEVQLRSETMLEAIGIAAIAVVAALVVFYAALRLMDHWRWWSEAGLAAFIPMFAVAVPLAISAAGLVVWLVS